jgi:hypothetical protein
MPVERMRHTHDMTLFRHLATVWLVVAQLTLGVALAVAIVLYSHRGHSVRCAYPGEPGCRPHQAPGWIPPTALGIALLGAALAAGLLLIGRRRDS